jgi:hypothetical protein
MCGEAVGKLWGSCGEAVQELLPPRREGRISFDGNEEIAGTQVYVLFSPTLPKPTLQTVSINTLVNAPCGPPKNSTKMEPLFESNELALLCCAA